MRKMFKYKLTNELKDFILPHGSNVRFVGMQLGVACVWAEVPVEEMPWLPAPRIVVIGTGGDVPEGLYLGTVLMHDDAIVLHFYVQ